MDSNQRSELIVRTAAKLSPEDRVRVAERILDVKDEPVLNAYHRCADLVAIAEFENDELFYRKARQED